MNEEKIEKGMNSKENHHKNISRINSDFLQQSLHNALEIEI